MKYALALHFMAGDAANASADILKAKSLGAKVAQHIIDKLRKALE